MIVREWRGRASLANPDAYPEHFRAVVLPQLRATPGFVGAQLLARALPGHVEFLVLSRWRSMGAVLAFAGENAERAVVEPGGVAALTDFDAVVRHYELLEDA